MDQPLPVDRIAFALSQMGEGKVQIFNYRITKDSLQVCIGNWVVRQIQLSDIAAVREGMTFWNEHWTNPLPFRFVTIVRKTGLIRNFVINPPDREGFIRELRAAVK